MLQQPQFQGVICQSSSVNAYQGNTQYYRRCWIQIGHNGGGRHRICRHDKFNAALLVVVQANPLSCTIFSATRCTIFSAAPSTIISAVPSTTAIVLQTLVLMAPLPPPPWPPFVDVQVYWQSYHIQLQDK